ncbi:MAG: TetR/AcrR family transcriptional regulator [Planctomycetes bacterium]|nr:TetR/AcrR family transcriptional regulator [Planctomycetota bacterium]
MGTEKQATEVRQEQIAQAALDLAGKQGLKGLSIAGIAEEVGLAPSAIYRHFKSKDEVIDASLALIRQRLHANVEAVCEDTSDAIERLRLLQIRHVRLIRENQATPRVVFSEESYDGHPERKARVYEMISSYLREVAEIVRQGQEAGTIRCDVEPGTVALMLLGLIQPAAILWHMSDGEFDVTAETQKTWELFRRAVATGS